MNSLGKEENDVWNETHVRLVRDLEKRGTLWRYATRHLKFWTDEIVNGNSGGINEEPEWENHLDVINVPPKLKKTQMNKMSVQDTVSNQFTPFMEMLMLQHQQRMEEESKKNQLFQETLLTLASPRYQVIINQCYCGAGYIFGPKNLIVNIFNKFHSTLFCRKRKVCTSKRTFFAFHSSMKMQNVSIFMFFLKL